MGGREDGRERERDRGEKWQITVNEISMLHIICILGLPFFLNQHRQDVDKETNKIRCPAEAIAVVGIKCINENPTATCTSRQQVRKQC